MLALLDEVGLAIVIELSMQRTEAARVACRVVLCVHDGTNCLMHDGAFLEADANKASAFSRARALADAFFGEVHALRSLDKPRKVGDSIVYTRRCTDLGFAGDDVHCVPLHSLLDSPHARTRRVACWTLASSRDKGKTAPREACGHAGSSVAAVGELGLASPPACSHVQHGQLDDAGSANSAVQLIQRAWRRRAEQRAYGSVLAALKAAVPSIVGMFRAPPATPSLASTSASALVGHSIRHEKTLLPRELECDQVVVVVRVAIAFNACDATQWHASRVQRT